MTAEVVALRTPPPLTAEADDILAPISAIRLAGDRGKQNLSQTGDGCPYLERGWAAVRASRAITDKWIDGR